MEQSESCSGKVGGDTSEVQRRYRIGSCVWETGIQRRGWVGNIYSRDIGAGLRSWREQVWNEKKCGLKTHPWDICFEVRATRRDQQGVLRPCAQGGRGKPRMRCLEATAHRSRVSNPSSQVEGQADPAPGQVKVMMTLTEQSWGRAGREGR